jgi:hypothetical protein
LCFVQLNFRCSVDHRHRDKEVVGVFVRFFVSPQQSQVDEK